MTGNVGKDDRNVRILIGLGFISMVFMGPETNWGWIGIVPLLTAIVGYCPLSTKLGYNTKKLDADKAVESTSSSESTA